ncbi:MAG: hypothetical protein MUC76_11900, partial [Spirochaetes bacterium]|nr:hypothetical protein [Spirochaetota bacterium]
MNRYAWVSAALMMIITLCLSAGCKRKAGEADSPVGMIISLNGEVAVNGKPASVDGTVEYGDTVITGLKSWCRIAVDGQNIIKVGPDSV